MPIYTYRCMNCGVQFEQQQRFDEQSLTRCPECSKKTLRKIYQPVGIVFKGSGFYATDHRSPSGANRSTTTGKSGEESKSSEESKASEGSKPSAGKDSRAESSPQKDSGSGKESAG
jgi:putative FmdB family regulatory protein